MKHRYALPLLALAFLLSLTAAPLGAQSIAWTDLGSIPEETYIMSFAVDAQERVFVATLNGTLWRTTDDGKSWDLAHSTPLSGGADGVVIGPTNNVYHFGHGLHRSTDGGNTWETLLDTVTIYSIEFGPKGQLFASSFGMIYRTANEWSGQWTSLPLGVDPVIALLTGPDGTLLAAATGIRRSTDSGSTWSMVDQTMPLQFASDSYERLYAASYAGVYRSTDGGTQWSRTEVRDGAEGLLPFTIAVDAAGTIYVGGVLLNGNGYGIFESSDAGLTWSRIAGTDDFGNVGDVSIAPNDDLYAADTMHVYRRTITSGIDVAPKRPKTAVTAIELAQNVPNPASGRTTIEFAVPGEGPVRLDLFDARGARLGTPVDDVYLPGRWSVEIDTRALAPGVYIYRLQAETTVLTKRMVVTR